MARFVLAHAAFADLEDIEAHTLETWGAEQCGRYIRGLFERFDEIAAHPGLGRTRDELAPGVKSLPHEQHVIFYECLADDPCVVLRVLHGRRDVSSAFAPG